MVVQKVLSWDGSSMYLAVCFPVNLVVTVQGLIRNVLVTPR